MPANQKIYLASASLRRQELLRQIGLDFEVMPADISEHIHTGESAETYVQRTAAEKAGCVARQVVREERPRYPVLGADTAVVLDDEILGKPWDRAHGMGMLRRLSGRTHEVLTAIAINHEGREHPALSVSRVTFGRLSEAAIARYWDSGEPADKAGGYAIQGRGAAFVARLEGSYSGVVGLPIYELVQLLSGIGLEPR